LPKEGTYPSPNLSPHGERLKKIIAETDDYFYFGIAREACALKGERCVFIGYAGRGDELIVDVKL